MTERRDNEDGEMQQDLEILRKGYARLSQEAPTTEVDDNIRRAAARQARRYPSRSWAAAFATAACIGLAVVLVPSLLLLREPAPAMKSTELVLIESRDAAQPPELAADYEVLPLAASPARPTAENFSRQAPAPEAEQQRLELRAELQRERTASLAESETSRETQAEPLERVEVTGSRTQRTDAEAAADVDARALTELRAELADADEATWRKRLLALHEDGDEAKAAALLADFRQRFERADSLTIEALAREEAAAGGNSGGD